MALIFIRTILLYLLLLLAMKIMGKRQIGQLQPFELVVVLIVSEMATLAMQSNTTPLLNSVLPIAVITLLQVLLSIADMKSERLRALLCGRPSVVICHGRLQQKTMARLLINITDLQELCRAQGYFDLSAIETAILETNGQLSIRPRADKRPLQTGDLLDPPPHEQAAQLLVLDGRVNRRALRELGKDEAWLQSSLQCAQAGPIDGLYLAGTDEQGRLFWQAREQRA